MALLLLRIQSAYLQTNDKILKELRLHSKPLQEQLDRYNDIGHKYSTKFYYEVYPTKLSGGKSMKVC